jgi:thioredoxin-related protein
LKWFTDYQEALNDARSKQRPILINFTGSDWCGWCIRLKKEILDTDEFKKYADEKLVLLEIDFPRRKQLTPSLQDANRKLMEKFGVQGFPTLFLLNPEGKTIKELGYMPGGPNAFIAALESAEI